MNKEPKGQLNVLSLSFYDLSAFLIWEGCTDPR